MFKNFSIRNYLKIIKLKIIKFFYDITNYNLSK